MKISFIQAAIVTFCLGVQYATAQTLPSGTYQFVSRVLDPSGNKLAITNNGENNAVTVTPLVLGQANQSWPVTNFESVGNQITVFGSNGALEIGIKGSGFPQTLFTLPNDLFIWASANVQGSITLASEDGALWGISNATSGTQIIAQAGTAGFLQLWIPTLVS